MRKDTFLWEKLRWPEIKEAADNDAIVIVPVGATEQHGLALPVGTDTADLEAIVHKAVKKLIGKVQILVTPSIWTGYSPTMMDFPGSITLEYETLGQVVYQTVKSILQHGFKRVVIANGHGGNVSVLNLTVDRLSREFNLVIPCVTHWDLIWDTPRSLEILETRPAFGKHPGEYETSVSWAVSPDLISENDREDCTIKPKSKFLEDGSVKIFTPRKAKTYNGAEDRCTLASKEKGEKLVEYTVEEMVKFLTEFKQWNVEDVSSLYEDV